MGVSKNSRMSKKQEVIRPKKEKKRKQEILFEITPETMKEFKEQGDLSFFRGNKVDRIVSRYGKQYIVIIREQ